MLSYFINYLLFHLIKKLRIKFKINYFFHPEELEKAVDNFKEIAKTLQLGENDKFRPC